MHPFLFNTVPLYFVLWGCAAIVGLTAGTRVVTSAGFPAGRSAIAIALLAVSILLGSKLLYLAEVHWFPFDDYVPLGMRGASHGFRIPGGILLLAAAMPIVCGALGLSWRRFGDSIIPMAALAVVFIRVGCFLNGCCFGRRSSLPWALAFPPDSWVFWYQRKIGWVSPEAQASLPVHPLQLYFVTAAAMTLIVVLRQQRRAAYAGQVQLLFYVVFFGSTTLLEPLRENYLTLNNWLAPVATVIPAGILLGRRMALPRPPVLNAQRDGSAFRNDATGRCYLQIEPDRMGKNA